jgi:hypothetical protein
MLDNITKADITEVRKGIVKCQDLEEMCKRGIACGIDCQEISDRCQQAKEFLTAVNQLYGPAFPAKTA